MNTGQYNFLTNADVTVKANSPQTNYAVTDAPLSQGMPITLDTNLFSSGLSNLAVYTNGVASIDKGTSLTLAQGGTVTLQAGQVDMLGSINVAGGSVGLNTVQTVSPAFNTAGVVNIGGNISTRGTWVNDSAFFGAPDTSKAIISNGGNISINSGNDLVVAPDLTIDASAGGRVDQSGKVHGGNGGNISIVGGDFRALNPDGTAGSNLSNLDGIALKSYGVDTGKGGSFKLAAGNDIQVGGVAASGALLLPAEFFQSGGFSSYEISSAGNKGLNVSGRIQPKAQSLILNRDATVKATGTDVYAMSNPGFLPDWQRNPVNITLGQTGGGSLSIGTDTVPLSDVPSAEILVDPTASITLNATNQLNVFGTLAAPAGTINLNLKSASASYMPTQSIWLGSESKLLGQGYFQKAQPNAQNLTQGRVLDGGKINIGGNSGTTNQGYVVALTGSVMDVSGTSANIDLPQLDSGSLVYRRSHVSGGRRLDLRSRLTEVRSSMAV